jgi:membrane associated rhomboid family serine protease
MEKSFFAALIDNSFTTFITRRVATVLYSILMVLIAILVGVAVVTGLIALSRDGLLGLLIVLSGVLGGFVTLILIRLGFESAVALVLVAENTSKGKASK